MFCALRHPRPAICGLVLAAAMALIAPAGAETRANGCFERTYSAEHLQRNPGQQIRRLIVRIGKFYTTDVTFGAEAWLRGKRQPWTAGGPCRPTETGWSCQPDTDGAPPITIETRTSAMRFLIPVHLKMHDDRNGPDLNEVILAGPADRVFLLSPTPASACRRE